MAPVKFGSVLYIEGKMMKKQLETVYQLKFQSEVWVGDLYLDK